MWQGSKIHGKTRANFHKFSFVNALTCDSSDSRTNERDVFWIRRTCTKFGKLAGFARVSTPHIFYAAWTWLSKKRKNILSKIQNFRGWIQYFVNDSKQWRLWLIYEWFQKLWHDEVEFKSKCFCALCWTYYMSYKTVSAINSIIEINVIKYFILSYPVHSTLLIKGCKIIYK